MKRIVSLVPSITETLFHLGLDPEITGITESCIHPAGKVTSRIRVGNTKTLDIPSIQRLEPDLIIANREENTKDQVEALIHAGLNVWVTSPESIADVVGLVVEIPCRTDSSPQTAAELIRKIKAAYRFCQLQRSTETPRVACLIWKSPWMAVGPKTYIHHLLEAAGASNVFVDSHKRYPETTLQELLSLEPDIVLFPSEPYPFSHKDIQEFATECPALPAVKNNRLELIVGEQLCWFGARTPSGLETMYQVFHPGSRWGFSY